MTSSLRYQVEPSASLTSPVLRTSSTSPILKIQRPCPTQIFLLADTALEKLTNEAERGGNDLRLVVGHANVLNVLMVELAEIEQREDEDL